MSSTPNKLTHTVFQAEKAKVIHVFGNGDKYQIKGLRVLIHPTKVKSIDQLKTEFSEQLGLATGPVRKIIDQSNNIIISLDQFQDNAKYLCCGPEKIILDALPSGFKDGFESNGTPVKTPTPKKEGSGSGSRSHSTPNTPILKYTPEKPDSRGREKGKNIMIYEGGNKHHDGIALVIHPKKFKTLDQVKEFVGRAINSPIKKVYNISGELIKSLEEFEDGKNYIGYGFEAFSKETRALHKHSHTTETGTSPRLPANTHHRSPQHHNIRLISRG